MASSPSALRAAFWLMVLGLAFAAGSCRKKNGAPATAPVSEPTVRVAVLSTLAGALEPCGCQKDMLGGFDHAAALLEGARGKSKGQIVVGAGPMFFMNPEVGGVAATQEIWKGEAIAESLAEVGLVAWSPGANDWAAGAERLAAFEKKTGAGLLAANLTGNVAGAAATRLIDVAGHKVGVVGASLPLIMGAPPEGVRVSDPRAALERGKKELSEQGAKLHIALISAPRGEALRLVEAVPGFHLVVIGKPFDRGEGNDAPTPPVLLGSTLVVQPPNHLQALSIVDFHVRGDSFEFQDGIGITLSEKRQRLQSRVDELSTRIAEWEKNPQVNAKDVEARRKELAHARQELGKLAASEPPKQGSYFRYELLEVRESAGADAKVSARMANYYKRVNAHNKEAFKDRKPEPAGPNQASYVGVQACKSCHLEEHAFYMTMRHSRAYATLEKDHKQFNLECVDCHVTGYDKPGGSTVTHVDNLKDVQCEVCHGPGSRHVADPANKEFIVKTPEKSMCASACHHPPHVGPKWDVEEAWKKIIGPGHGQ